MIKWNKYGLIFEPQKRFWWLQSHCQLPCVLYLNGNNFRVYFAGRDERQYSHIGYIEMDITKPSEIIKISEEPVLLPGDIGFFDEHGVYPSSIIKVEEKIYLYYIGWTKGVEPPLFYASIGLAISHDGGETFEKHSPSPILSRSSFDPCLVTAPNVFKQNDNSYSMIYTSGIKWKHEQDGSLRSFYHLKYAKSKDGIDWIREGKTVIDLKDENERDISRSTLIFEGGIYKIWFGYNTVSTPYRIGYAESKDLNTWIRKDNLAGIDVSQAWYENEMICYPNIFEHKGKHYMLYNGNRFGKDGIILATSL